MYVQSVWCGSKRIDAHARKVAAIKFILKPDNDDYTRPKPHSLISLPVRRLLWHLMPKLQVIQYGFKPQHGT
ncbi:hypothetical protein EVAR_64910_1 [Eumeta japonica]|uniref:Uncharacterized protein n=1 Tax=Eumeta variegata TaxID=151549 RepID=A0A4C2AEZ8_EUMVA|nr:hypothetical protein EVAR_64910_1 [Eumeta japonica]